MRLKHRKSKKRKSSCMSSSQDLAKIATLIHKRSRSKINKIAANSFSKTKLSITIMTQTMMISRSTSPKVGSHLVKYMMLSYSRRSKTRSWDFLNWLRKVSSQRVTTKATMVMTMGSGQRMKTISRITTTSQIKSCGPLRARPSSSQPLMKTMKPSHGRRRRWLSPTRKSKSKGWQLNLTQAPRVSVKRKEVYHRGVELLHAITPLRSKTLRATSSVITTVRAKIESWGPVATLLVETVACMIGTAVRSIGVRR